MSYKKAFALSALGLGLALQGCKDDDEDGVVDKGCATVTDFDNVKAGTNDVEKCTTCLDGAITANEDCDAYDDYAAAKTAGIGSGADKLVAMTCVLEAWSECSVSIPTDATSCDDLTALAAAPAAGSAGATTVVTALAGASFDCQVCLSAGTYAGDAPTCAESSIAIEQCSSDALTDAIKDSYRCPDCASYGSADAALCTACLDAQQEGKWADLDVSTPAEVKAKWEKYEACGYGGPAATECNSLSIGSAALNYDVTNIDKNTEFLTALNTASTGSLSTCSTCVQAFQGLSRNGHVNCYTYNDALAACSDGTITNAPVCLAGCSSGAANDDANCQRCLIAFNDGADIDLSTDAGITLTDIKLYTDAYSQSEEVITGGCDAGITVATDQCSGDANAWTAGATVTFAANGNADQTSIDNIFAFAVTQGNTCVECLHRSIANSNTLDCDAINTAVAACSAQSAATDVPYTCQ